MTVRGSSCAVFLAGLAITMLAASAPAAADPWEWQFGYRAAKSYFRSVPKRTYGKAEKKKKKSERAAIKPIPSGTLQVIVAINTQRVTLYANGEPVAQAPVSTGTPTHPTPTGLFTVIQKNRHHYSNLYGAAMPYMQRITWSGAAMHHGPLPGYPASHGCIRLPADFAAMLWKTTRLGTRVVVARDETAPVEIQHPGLFVPKPKALAVTPRPRPLVKTADGSDIVPGVVLQDAAQSIEAVPIAPALDQQNLDEHSMLTEAVASARDVQRRSSPVSVFVSRKDRKLYVRQGMQPLLEVPVTIQLPEQPIGTHVYTAMEFTNGGAGMRWTAISIPSSYSSPVSARQRKSSPRAVTPAAAPSLGYGPPPTASKALDRLELPQDVRDRIGSLLSPGSSLIVSDNSLASGETGVGTDFIVLTR
jgi:lipoprotein-anchoring transpeptidase ErfK/SrfK